MKWPAYPRYRASGVEWIGEIPEHWATPPRYTRYAVDLGKMLNEARITRANSLPYLRNVDAQWDHINFENLPEMDVTPAELDRYTIRAGDLLVCEGGEVGRAAIVPPLDGCYAYQKALHRLRPARSSESPRFMLYTLFAAASRGVFIAEGNPNTIPHLTGDKLRHHRFPCPPEVEQCAIVGFLDAQTEKLDALVEKKRAMIERLKEKRAALISRTVTRGLPTEAARAAGSEPHPELKPSGVEWLGDVPAHWKVLQLRRRYTILDCKHRTVPFVDDGVPVVSIREVGGQAVDLSEAKRSTEEDYIEMIAGDRRPRLGDIIYSRNATVGAASLVTTNARFCMGQDVCLIRSHECARFLLYTLKSRALSEQLEARMIGSTVRRINVGQIKDFWLALPPREEQKAIADYLDRETARIDRLIAKVEQAIATLQEYRAALITAAVTGKIDVRGFAANARTEATDATDATRAESATPVPA